jgi:(1->4)-alpha-D-glucan 1-alpha-D-glucosylmutase
MVRPSRIPAATYRLQLRRELPFAAAGAAIPYLRLLGVSDLYLSPLYAARPASVHGYDIVDHTRLNPELGDEAALKRLLDDAAAAEMGVLLDVVPNHMCIADDANHPWMEVLEDGRDSPSAATFDIDWEPPKAELVGKVLLPFLEEQYGRVLERGLAIGFEAGRFFLAFGERRLPLAAESWRLLLEPALEKLRGQLAAEDPAVIDLESIVRALVHTLAPLRRAGATRFVEHRHEKEAIKHRLAALAESSAAVRTAIGDIVIEVNGTPGNPRSFDRLERLLDEQCYRLANWRVAAHEINYRRFFDINDLAAVRVEDPTVFANMHALPFEIGAHPAFTGFRIDHVDGLSDPEQYLANLSAGWNERRAASGWDDLRPADLRPADRRPFVVVEKILGPGEILPPGWLADGTTGYEFISILGDLFIRAEGEARLRATAARFGSPPSFDQLALESKRLVLQTNLAAELTVLARRLDRVSEQHRYTRDFTLNHLQAALGEIIASFPVYRTYIRRDDQAVSERDRAVIVRAVATARRRNPLLNASLFDFIESVLLCQEPAELEQAQIEERRTLVTRFQQLTGPVVAKGIEDTAFYRYLPLIAANEVGCHPGRLGKPASEAHRALQARREGTPHTLSATATHDTKRGEDARARLHVLSELPGPWRDAVLGWRRDNTPLRTTDDLPEPLTETFIYGALVGAWPPGGLASAPDFTERFVAYVVKAITEAKLHTSWINPDAGYETAVAEFVRALLDGERSAAFLTSLEGFVARVAPAGYLNGLAQVLLKVAAPGVPDVYGGTELWDFALADPDNRRPVDFARRISTLAEVRRRAEVDARATARELLACLEDGTGAIKAFVLHRALATRAAHPAAFESATYTPCAARGALARHVVAFARGDAGQRVLAVTGRLYATLTEGGRAPVGDVWRDTTVAWPAPATRVRTREALTDRALVPEVREGTCALPLATLFEDLPVALIVEEPA